MKFSTATDATMLRRKAPTLQDVAAKMSSAAKATKLGMLSLAEAELGEAIRLGEEILAAGSRRKARR